MPSCFIELVSRPVGGNAVPKNYNYTFCFYAPGHIVIEPSICPYEVNLERQVGFFSSSTCTNGFLVYTLTNQYKVHDLVKLHNYGFYIYQVIALFSTMKMNNG
jgi:hypothetical protein